MKDWNNFFGSKLNTVLLLVLILLMVAAIHFMLRDKGKYFPYLEQNSNAQILGNKDDLVSFSISPGAKVQGLVSYRGEVKNNYFFEANIRINVLDRNKGVLKQDHAMATTDWMTSGPVSFEGKIDFSGLPQGPAYFEIHNDNPSDLPENDKSVLIPIVIE